MLQIVDELTAAAKVEGMTLEEATHGATLMALGAPGVAL